MTSTELREKSEILVVDDELALRSLLSQVLGSAGFEVTAVATGEEALAAFRNTLHPVVIADVRLPGMSGLQLLDEIKKMNSDTQVILMTGFASLETAVTAIRASVYDYLIKPFEDLSLILAVANRAMEKVRLLRENRALLSSLRDKNQELEQVNRVVNRMAIRDSLTNLYNRRFFAYRMKEELARALHNKQKMAIFLCDVDHFKEINDTWGHQVGDEVLKSVAHGIQEATRGTDLVFRWGGDEIVVVLCNVDREGALIAGDRIRKAIKAIGKASKAELDLSIGVAMFPEHGDELEGLIRLADRAVYIAKKGGDKVHIGQEEFNLNEDAIRVVFQPVVNLQSQKVIGYEALSRDAQGRVSIVELFKRYHAVGQLNHLKEICFNAQMRASKYLEVKRLFLNVDFNLLHPARLFRKPPGMEVVLEISEREALHDVENLLKTVRMWRDQGFEFAIDDFGAGFISLPFVARLIPDYIKLDRSTVLQSVSSEEFRSFMKSLIPALQNYAADGIIAEGIETAHELEVVKDLGIRLGQGFLLGKPQELYKGG